MAIFRLYQWAAILFALLFISACANKFSISTTGISITDRMQESGQVHAYPNMPEKYHQLGPYYVLHIVTEDDVPNLASKLTHHLYFSLIPCSQTEHGYELWNGGVFIDARTDSGTNARSGNGRNLNRYVVHIPVKAEQIIRHVHGVGALDAKRYLARASQEDLCVRMGGGQMWGASLSSNSARTQLHFDEKAGFSVTP